MSVGARDLGDALLEEGGTLRHPAIVRRCVHELALAYGRFDVAEHVESGLSRCGDIDDLTISRLVAMSRFSELSNLAAAQLEMKDVVDCDHREQADAAPDVAPVTVGPLRSVRDAPAQPAPGSAISLSLLPLYLRFGDYATVVRSASDAAKTGPASTSHAVFDAYWALGEPDAASDVLFDAIRRKGHAIGSIQRFVSLARYKGWTDTEASDRLLAIDRIGDDPMSLHDHMAVLFEFNRLDEMCTVGERARVHGEGGPGATYFVARAHYARRDFAAARSTIRSLLGSARDRDARKLDARIRFEEGDFEAAYERRRRVILPRDGFDEVLFFARLHLGKLESAFASYLYPAARADAHHVFPTSFDETAIRPTRSRAVIAQDGPGDEILAASLYQRLAQRGERVSAVCEPRMFSLLERSIADVEFIPAARQASRPTLGFANSEHESRARGPLHWALSMTAMEKIQDHDCVSLARSLWRLTTAPDPSSAYLRPRSDLVSKWREYIKPGSIGIVWRSEFVDAMRGIHFVTADDLHPLNELDTASFVCLQSDVTLTERATLHATFGDRIQFFDDVDLRNDFENVAALVGVLSAVIGPGTTTLELSAAVGTTAVYLHPNVFGQWRISGNRDHWHTSMHHACASSPQMPATCVVDAVRVLRSAGFATIPAGQK